jgi:hypothetical protein
MMMLLNEAVMWASPTASTTTFLFLVLLPDFAIASVII